MILSWLGITMSSNSLWYNHDKISAGDDRRSVTDRVCARCLAALIARVENRADSTVTIIDTAISAPIIPAITVGVADTSSNPTHAEASNLA